MSQFLDNFLTEGGGSPGTGRFLALGAFGKHPGWDDHVEDLGLETETLALAKRILYVQGVGGQIDTGAWEKLEPAQRAEGFDHIFVWQRSRQFLLGKMWSSSDGKGRTRYPMVICVECRNSSLGWALQNVLPKLDEVELACKGTAAAQDVRSILDRARAELRAALGGPAAGDEYAMASADALARFVSEPTMGPDQEGWFRLLYQIRNQMAAYRLGSFNSKTEPSSLRPQQVRVPAAALSAEQAILLWTRFFASRIDGKAPMFFALPVSGGWMDVVLGEPATHEFFGLRALPAGLPLVTEVPYTIDEAFKAQARQSLAEFQAGKAVSPEASTAAEESSGSGWASITQRWFRGKGTKLLLLSGLVLVAASAAVVFNRHSSGTREVAQPSAREQVTAPSSPKPQPAVAKAEPPAVPKSAPAKAPLLPTTPPPSSGQKPLVAAASPSVPPTKGAATTPGGELSGTEPATGPHVPTTDTARVAPPAQSLSPAVPPVTDASRAPPGGPVKIAAVDVAAPAPTPSARPATPSASSLPPTNISSSVSTPTADVQTPGSKLQSPSTHELGSSALPGAVASAPPSVASAINHQAPVARSSPITNSIGMVLMWISPLPGTAEGAWAGKFEVTQKEFETVMGSNPSKFQDPLRPVENVTWQNSLEFCRKLNGRETQAGTLPAGFAYTLPTQAQWDALLGDASFENAVTSRDRHLKSSTSTVGSLSPNQFGLYDVLGNVWEWCADPSSGPERLLKGGAFSSINIYNFRALEPRTVRHLTATNASPDAGFRCLLAP